MPKKLRPVDYEDRLSLVEHLDELRSRIVVSAIALGVGFALAAWQNHLLLELLNAPLPRGQEPITLSPTEPFLTTITLSLYAGIVLSLPVILYQGYAFVLPAFSPNERRVAVPLLLMVPLLFIAGVVFTYFVVLSPAIQFLLNFNASEFNTQLRARDYYSFTTLLMLAMGILFQVPIGVLAITRLGIVTPETLAKNRRYAILGCAVIAALLPTIDPVTLILEMVPLLLLFELSLVLARAFGRPASEAADQVASAESS